MHLSITLLIIIITVVVSISGFSNQQLVDRLIFYPPAITRRNEWYRFFSCGLIHADVGHLVFNMLSLYMFGEFVEEAFVAIFDQNGKWLYLAMYVLALLFSLLPTYFNNRNNYYYKSLGASGAVSAVIFAGLMVAPQVDVGIIFLPFLKVPGFIFGPLYLLVSALLDRRGDSNINHSAHFWGGIFGILFIIIAGRTVGYNAIEAFWLGVKSWLASKGLLH